MSVSQLFVALKPLADSPWVVVVVVLLVRFPRIVASLLVPFATWRALRDSQTVQGAALDKSRSHRLAVLTVIASLLKEDTKDQTATDTAGSKPPPPKGDHCCYRSRNSTR